MFQPLGAALIIASNPASGLPGCWTVTPGPSIVNDAQMDGWYLGEQHLLDTPKSWSVHRTYDELQSYGFCEAGELILKTADTLYAKATPPAPPPASPLEVTDDVLKRAIGRAEGTRDVNGNPNSAYHGHDDPLQNGRCKNQGSFSYQHCAANPEEADRKWLAVLRERAMPRIQSQSEARFGEPLSSAAMVVALDGYTQSPDAGLRFVGFLATYDPTPEQLIAARIAALEASRAALGGRPMNVNADQRRRVMAVLGQLERLTNDRQQH